jgi:hypothetical protein
MWKQQLENVVRCLTNADYNKIFIRSFHIH